MKKRIWTFLLVPSVGAGPVRSISVPFSAVAIILVLLLLPVGGAIRALTILGGPVYGAAASSYEYRRAGWLGEQAARLGATLERVLVALSLGELAAVDDAEPDSRASRSHVVLAGIALFPDILDPLRTAVGRAEDLSILHGIWRFGQPRSGCIPDALPVPGPGFPSHCPSQGVITSYYGIRTDPVYEGTALHRGIDIAWKTRSPIRVAADGVVVFAGAKARYGNVVVVDHPSTGYRTVYAHLHTVLVSSRQTVSRGDIIGSLGNTGKSTGPHLHYEVIRGGKAVDPLAFILPHDAVVD